MEKLVCDLKNALDLNKRINNKCNFSKVIKSPSSQNKIYRHHLSKNHQKSNLDYCKLTKSIVSQAVLSASSLNNLVRLKTTNSNNRREQSKLYVKTRTPRKIYKIQKKFRFRNYRLRCIRLRRESRQQYKNKYYKRQLLPQTTINFNLNSSLENHKIIVNNKSLTQENENGVMSSSSIDSNDNSSLSATSNSFFSTSISSVSDNELSLTEHFKSTKFLNSSDPSKEDEDDEETKGSKCVENFIKNKNSKKVKPNSTLTRKSSRKIERSSKNTNKGRVAIQRNTNYFDRFPNRLENIDQVLNGKAMKRKRFKDEEDENLVSGSYSLNYVLNVKSGFEVNKKLRLKNTSSQKLEYGRSFSQALFKESKKDNKSLKANKNEDTSEKETDEENTKVLIDLKKSCIKKLSSRRGNRDDLEADDEQSDWPSNEKTPLQQMKALQKKMDIESLDNLKLSVFPCWEKNDIESARKATYYETFLQDSNYEIMNRSESVEKGKELGEILNGALSLMSSTTKDIYHSKIKSMASNGGKLRSRSNSLATGSMKLATKSATNLDNFFNNKNGQIKADLKTAPSFTESKKGYRLY